MQDVKKITTTDIRKKEIEKTNNNKKSNLYSRLAASFISADIGRVPRISGGGAGWYPPSGGLGVLISCSTVEVHLLLAKGSTYLYTGVVHSPIKKVVMM